MGTSTDEAKILVNTKITMHSLKMYILLISFISFYLTTKVFAEISVTISKSGITPSTNANIHFLQHHPHDQHQQTSQPHHFILRYQPHH